jgi:hypothetical protein
VGLSIQVRSDKGAVVVALVGGVDAPMLDPLSAALADARALVLDLDEVTTPDAAGLRDAARGDHLRTAAGHEANAGVRGRSFGRRHRPARRSPLADPVANQAGPMRGEDNRKAAT